MASPDPMLLRQPSCTTPPSRRLQTTAAADLFTTQSTGDLCDLVQLRGPRSTAATDDLCDLVQKAPARPGLAAVAKRDKYVDLVQVLESR